MPPHQPLFKIFGVGLALGLWLYSGYEQLSTVAEEVENPQRSYPRALALVVPLSIAAYFLPTFTGLAAAGNWEKWHTGFFSDAARLIGGPWLGTWMTLAAMVGNVALLNSTVLTTTRMPFAMAEDGYLPQVLTRKHPRYGTPWIAIVVIGRHLQPAGAAEPDSTHLRLHLAALVDHGADGPFRMETPPNQARDAARIPSSGREPRPNLCGGSARW